MLGWGRGRSVVTNTRIDTHVYLQKEWVSCQRLMMETRNHFS